MAVRLSPVKGLLTNRLEQAMDSHIFYPKTAENKNREG